MIDLYFWPTPNCYKVSILLEELMLPYNVIGVHIGKGQQFEDRFTDLNPNRKVPVLVDYDGPDGKPITIFESGAIMMFLSEKAGQFLPKDVRSRMEVLQWLMFQMGGIGPMLGQAHHFREYAKDEIPYAIDRYTREAARIYSVLERRLSSTEFIAGNYSIADMAVYPWIRPYRWQGQTLSDFPHLQRWYSKVRARPGVQRGLAVMREELQRNKSKPTGDAWSFLFGNEKPATNNQKAKGTES